MIRCPLCMASVRVVFEDCPPVGPWAWKTLAKADRIVARATFEDWAGRAEHLVTEHGWRAKLD